MGKKKATKIEMDEKDSHGRRKSGHDRIRAARVDGSKIAARNYQRIRDERVDGSKNWSKRT